MSWAELQLLAETGTGLEPKQRPPPITPSCCSSLSIYTGLPVSVLARVEFTGAFLQVKVRQGFGSKLWLAFVRLLRFRSAPFASTIGQSAAPVDFFGAGTRRPNDATAVRGHVRRQRTLTKSSSWMDARFGLPARDASVLTLFASPRPAGHYSPPRLPSQP